MGAMGRRDTVRMGGMGLLGLGAWVILAACGSDGGGTSSGDVVTETRAPVIGSGPPSACGGLASGQWVSGGGSAGSGADKLVLSVSPDEIRLDIKAAARAGGSASAVAYLTVYVRPSAEFAALTLSDDGRELRLTTSATATSASIAGDVFDELNYGFGGLLVEGRFCFDAVPVTGEALSGSWVFLLSVGTAEKLHRIQGSFTVPGAAVTARLDAGAAHSLEILTGDAATIAVE